MTKRELLINALLIALGLAGRLLPHAPNFAPIAAIALFSGVYLGRSYAILLPLAVMFVSDLAIGFYSTPVMLSVYGSYVVVGLLSQWVKKYKSIETVIAGSILASVIFFLITNWAVWQFGTMYPKTLAGLIDCFTMALPFFRNTLAGDLTYTVFLFGIYEVSLFLTAQKKAREMSVPA